LRFVVITLPPPEVCQAIEALRRPLNALVGAHEALRYPPHVTLRTGLVCPDEKADEVARAFLDHGATLPQTRATTAGLFFTTYGEPGALRGMVGWHLPLTEGLQDLHRGLLDFTVWAKGPQGRFQPHLSLAYHDLDPAGVETLRAKVAGSEVPDFTWTIDHVALYHERPEGWVEWGSRGLRPAEGSPTRATAGS
jgi:2'-5' RNA ligase